MDNLENIDVRSLPSLPLSWRKAFPPKVPVIYFALSQKNEVLYIGQSVNMPGRWNSHHRLKKLEEIGDVKIAWLEVSDRAMLPELELSLINRFNPIFNIHRIIPKPRSIPQKKWVAEQRFIPLTEKEAQELTMASESASRSECELIRGVLWRLKSRLGESIESNSSEPKKWAKYKAVGLSVGSIEKLAQLSSESDRSEVELLRLAVQIAILEEHSRLEERRSRTMQSKEAKSA